MTLHSNS